MNGHKRCGCAGEGCAHDDFAALLKARGLKNTRHRTALLELLSASEQPADAEQLYTELLAGGLSVNLSTVYRTLETLCAAELVTKLVLESGGKALYEYNDSVHRHHLVCVGCKKITPIASCPLGGYEQALAKETGYAVTGHKLDVYGYCPECKKGLK